MPLARISVTVPRDLLKAADRRARELDRSRSWLVAEAVRRYLAAGAVPASSGGRARVSEPGPPPYGATPAAVPAAAEVREARRRHLQAELRLPPSERLRRAEELGHLARSAQGLAPRRQIIGFDSYDDYYRWRKTRLIGA